MGSEGFAFKYRWPASWMKSGASQRIAKNLSGQSQACTFRNIGLQRNQKEYNNCKQKTKKYGGSFDPPYFQLVHSFIEGRKWRQHYSRRTTMMAEVGPKVWVGCKPSYLIKKEAYIVFFKAR